MEPGAPDPGRSGARAGGRRPGGGNVGGGAGASPEVALEPGAAIAQGKARAAALIAQGRGTEARALLMAIEAMERAAPPEAETAEAPGGGLNGQGLRGEALKDAGMRALLITLERDAVIRSLATTVAHAMLAKPETAPVGQLPYVDHWRARNLGPEVAERDRAAEAAGGYGETFWDEEGRMRDLLEMDLALIDRTRRMWRAMWNLPVEDGPWEELEAGDG